MTCWFLLRRYLAWLVLANVAWESAQLPLYTIWRTRRVGAITFAIAHCTLGDVVIGVSALMLAIAIAGSSGWPARGFARVAAVTTVLGIAYAIFSEWLNVSVRGSWAYADAMPSVLGIGLLPVFQWVVLPPVGLCLARR